MKYKNRRQRGRLRKLTNKDRVLRTAHNKRTHRAGKLWAKKTVVRDERKIRSAR